MITQCWRSYRVADLVWHGVCNCEHECSRKAELIDILMDWWGDEPAELTTAEMDYVSERFRRSLLGFKEL